MPQSYWFVLILICSIQKWWIIWPMKIDTAIKVSWSLFVYIYAKVEYNFWCNHCTCERLSSVNSYKRDHFCLPHKMSNFYVFVCSIHPKQNHHRLHLLTLGYCCSANLHKLNTFSLTCTTKQRRCNDDDKRTLAVWMLNRPSKFSLTSMWPNDSARYAEL